MHHTPILQSRVAPASCYAYGGWTCCKPRRSCRSCIARERCTSMPLHNASSTSVACAQWWAQAWSRARAWSCLAHVHQALSQLVDALKARESRLVRIEVKPLAGNRSILRLQFESETDPPDAAELDTTVREAISARLRMLRTVAGERRRDPNRDHLARLPRRVLATCLAFPQTVSRIDLSALCGRLAQASGVVTCQPGRP